MQIRIMKINISIIFTIINSFNVVIELKQNILVIIFVIKYNIPKDTMSVLLSFFSFLIPATNIDIYKTSKPNRTNPNAVYSNSVFLPSINPKKTIQDRPTVRINIIVFEDNIFR